MTIRDVAAQARVSTATVSRFMAGKTVRAADAIRRAIDALGYQPAPAAISLRSGVHHVIAVIVPDIANPYFASVVRGVETVFRDMPYNVFVMNSDESVTIEERLLQKIRNRVDGIIITPVAEHGTTPKWLSAPQQPLVFVDRELQGVGAGSVLVDNVGGAITATKYLLALGHAHIATIAGLFDTTPGRGRYDGFIQALLQAGVTVPPDYFQQGSFTELGGYDAMTRLLLLPTPPTAVFIANNLMTIGAIKSARDHDCRVGRDLSMIGFDDLVLGSVVTPAITVIDRPTVAQGVAAATMLAEIMGNKRERETGSHYKQVILDVTLVERGSCVRAARRAPRAAIKSMSGSDTACVDM